MGQIVSKTKKRNGKVNVVVSLDSENSLVTMAGPFLEKRVKLLSESAIM
jgi:hypothetical protein